MTPSEAQNEALAKAWDEGATLASPYGGGYLRSILMENPYRLQPGAAGPVED